jgi:hypothetical protein
MLGGSSKSFAECAKPNSALRNHNNHPAGAQGKNTVAFDSHEAGTHNKTPRPFPIKHPARLDLDLVSPPFQQTALLPLPRRVPSHRFPSNSFNTLTPYIPIPHHRNHAWRKGKVFGRKELGR